MELQERVYSVLIVSASEKFQNVLRSLLPESAYSPIVTVASVGAAERTRNNQDFDFVFVNSPLPDDAGIRFAIDCCRAGGTVVLLFAAAALYDSIQSRVEKHGVFVLPRPVPRDAILRGLKGDAGRLARQALEAEDGLSLVEGRLIPALDRVGEGYERGTVFLPQLLSAAQAAQAVFEAVRTHLADKGDAPVKKGRIAVATVRGDIHDIGKNIVRVLLENYGYRVIDLGKDVEPAAVVRAAQEHNAPLVGLSALMTTTLKSMEETVDLLHREGVPCKVMVGGAVLTPGYAEQIGADFYAKDAKQSVDIARQVINA